MRTQEKKPVFSQNQLKNLWDRSIGKLTISDSDGPSLLAASSGLMAIAAVYLYFIGFLYSYFFFQSFGVSLESLDLPTPYYLVHSYSVLNTTPGLLVFVLYVSVIYFWALFKLKRWLVLAVLLSGFPAFFHLGYGTAIRAAAELRSHPDTSVRITFKNPPPEKIAAGESSDPKNDVQKSIAQLSSEDKLWLLCETKDKIIVFSQPKSAIVPGLILPARVFTISLSDVEWSSAIVQ